MTKRGEAVPRPKRKSTEYEIIAASREAAKGWSDLSATHRNAMVDAWDHLTKTPTLETPLNYRLRGELATLTYRGRSYERWQYKPTARGSGRIWFFVDEAERRVYVEDVHTAHPNQTK